MNMVLTVSAVVTVIFAGLGYAAALGITRPIPRLVETMRRIAGGSYDEPVPYTTRGMRSARSPRLSRCSARTDHDWRPDGRRSSQQ